MKIYPDGTIEINVSDLADLWNLLRNCLVGKKRIDLKNVLVSNGNRNSIQFTVQNEPGFIYSTNLDITFSGSFGKKPKIYMVYSHSTKQVSINEREIVDDEITESKVGWFRYKFNFSKQCSYTSNTSLTTKPYLIIVEGVRHIGMGYIVSKENAFGLVEETKPNIYHFRVLTNPSIVSHNMLFMNNLNEVLSNPEINKADIDNFKAIEKEFKDCFFNYNN